MAEAQPPPVILYPHSQDQSHNNGAGHYSQGGTAIQPIEPPPQPPVNNYPTQYEPRLPETRHTGHTDGQSGTQAENRHTVTPHRPSNPPVLQPLGNVETSASAVSVLLLRWQNMGESQYTAMKAYASSTQKALYSVAETVPEHILFVNLCLVSYISSP